MPDAKDETLGQRLDRIPTEVRGMGSGFAEGTGRIAGIIGPIVAGYLVGFGYFIALTPSAVAFAISGLTILLFGPKTMGRTLE